jgi:hypothetical protein
MNMTTFSPKIYSRTEKSAKTYWKAGLCLANFVFALFLIRYGNQFSDEVTIPAAILVIGLFLLAGFSRLRHLGDGTRVKAYIQDHEAWALTLLGVFLIAATMFCVALQSRLDAGIEQPENGAFLKLAEDQLQARLSDELSPPIAMETASDMSSAAPEDSTASNPTAQPAELVHTSKRDHPHIHRRAVLHRHRR